MATPAISEAYTNQIVSSFDLHKPEKLATIFKRYGDQGMSYFLFMKSLGFDMPVAQETYSHFEENRYHAFMTALAGVSAPGAGNDITFVLDPVSLNANNQFYPRLNDAVLFPNEVSGYIVNINTATPSAPAITVRPNVVTDAIPAISAGDQIIIYSNQFAEGTENPKGALSGTEEFYNDTQIIKETWTATGTEMTNQSWVRLNNLPNAPYYLTGQPQTEYRYALKVDGALTFGKRTNNPNAIDTATGNPIRTTEGLVPAIRQRGNVIVSTPGTWSVANFDEIVRIYDREGASKTAIAMMGLNKLQENQSVLKAYFNNTNIQMAIKGVEKGLFRGNAEMSANLEFQYLTTAGYTFMFSQMGTFTNPQLYGAEGYGMKNYAIFLPVGKLKDPKSGKLCDNIGYRYKKAAGYDRMLEVWNGDSGAGPNKVTSRDVQNLYWRGHIGAHQMGVNQMVLVADR
jgi:hypothetical protein